MMDFHGVVMDKVFEGFMWVMSGCGDGGYVYLWGWTCSGMGMYACWCCGYVVVRSCTTTTTTVGGRRISAKVLVLNTITVPWS